MGVVDIRFLEIVITEAFNEMAGKQFISVRTSALESTAGRVQVLGMRDTRLLGIGNTAAFHGQAGEQFMFEHTRVLKSSSETRQALDVLGMRHLDVNTETFCGQAGEEFMSDVALGDAGLGHGGHSLLGHWHHGGLLRAGRGAVHV